MRILRLQAELKLAFNASYSEYNQSISLICMFYHQFKGGYHTMNNQVQHLIIPGSEVNLWPITLFMV